MTPSRLVEDRFITGAKEVAVLAFRYEATDHDD
jgi:hypothetical protein